MILQTCRYRLYPTKAQRKVFERTLKACCWTYNKALETRCDAWEKEKKNVPIYDLLRMLTQWRREQEWLRASYSQVLYEVLGRLDRAFQAFYRRCRAGEEPGYS